MENNYGLLVNQTAKLHRGYFNEMVRLLGVQVKYRVPINKNYSQYGELIASAYTDPVTVGCIFEEHLTPKTAKKLGWDAELTESAAVIHVPYDLPHIQIGCLFEIPSAFDGTCSRLFRVTKLSATMIYPSSIACEIVPEWADKLDSSLTNDFTKTDFNLLNEG